MTRLVSPPASAAKGEAVAWRRRLRNPGEGREAQWLLTTEADEAAYYADKTDRYEIQPLYAQPHPSQQAGTEGARDIAARAAYAARPARWLHPEERDISWDEAQTECPGRIATIYRDVDAILAALNPSEAKGQ